MNSACLLRIAAVCFLTGSAVWARDLKTTNGDVYKNITITKQDATGIQVSHDDGVIFLDFRSLAAAEQKEFGYDPKAYMAALKQKAEMEKARRDQALAAQQAAAQAKAQAQGQAGSKIYHFEVPQPSSPTTQTGVEYTYDSPGFRFGPYDYAGRGYSNTVPPRQGGPVPYPNNVNGPYPYYYGPTWGPTIIRQR